ncbi:MAG: rod shape-determining protein MreD, partial [Halanaerobiaceae bacterium]|nr:rod shape-determining protein MreD [Halanaerobiaceae bacterium]
MFLITALIFQLTYPPDWFFKGVRPDFLLVVVVVIGLISGVNGGVAFAFIAGILQNIFQGGFSGVYILIKVLIGTFSGFLEKMIFKDKYIFPPIVIFILTVINETVVILLSEKPLVNVN